MHVSYSRSPLKPRAHTSLPASAGRSITSGKRSRTTRLAHSLHVLADSARELEHAAAAENVADRLELATVVELVLLNVSPDRLERVGVVELVLAGDGRERAREGLHLEDALPRLLQSRRALLARRHQALALVGALLAAALAVDDALRLLLLLFLLLLLLRRLRLLGLLRLLPH